MGGLPLHAIHLTSSCNEGNSSSNEGHALYRYLFMTLFDTSRLGAVTCFSHER